MTFCAHMDVWHLHLAMSLAIQFLHMAAWQHGLWLCLYLES